MRIVTFMQGGRPWTRPLLLAALALVVAALVVLATRGGDGTSGLLGREEVEEDIGDIAADGGTSTTSDKRVTATRRDGAAVGEDDESTDTGTSRGGATGASGFTTGSVPRAPAMPGSTSGTSGTDGAAEPPPSADAPGSEEASQAPARRQVTQLKGSSPQSATFTLSPTATSFTVVWDMDGSGNEIHLRDLPEGREDVVVVKESVPTAGESTYPTGPGAYLITVTGTKAWTVTVIEELG